MNKINNFPTLNEQDSLFWDNKLPSLKGKMPQEHNPILFTVEVLKSYDMVSNGYVSAEIFYEVLDYFNEKMALFKYYNAVLPHFKTDDDYLGLLEMYHVILTNQPQYYPGDKTIASILPNLNESWPSKMYALEVSLLLLGHCDKSPDNIKLAHSLCESIYGLYEGKTSSNNTVFNFSMQKSAKAYFRGLGEKYEKYYSSLVPTKAIEVNSYYNFEAKINLFKYMEQYDLAEKDTSRLKKGVRDYFQALTTPTLIENLFPNMDYSITNGVMQDEGASYLFTLKTSEDRDKLSQLFQISSALVMETLSQGNDIVDYSKLINNALLNHKLTHQLLEKSATHKKIKI